MGLNRTVSNAAANITNGVSNAAFQIGMTAFVARAGSPGDLALWSVAAALSGFAPLVSCNLSAAIARRLVIAGSDEIRTASVVWAGRGLSARLTACGLVLAVVVGLGMPWLYPKLVGQDPWVASAVATSVFAGSCWVIAAQNGLGRWTAQHRNWPIAHAGLIGRGLALAAAALVLVVWPSVVWVAPVVAAIFLWTGLWAMNRRLRPVLRAPAVQTRDEAVHLIGLLKGFSVWGLTSAAIQAATVPMVAALAPDQATPFYLAFSLVGLVTGLAFAAGNALAVPVARLLAQPDPAGATRSCLRATYVLVSSVNAILLGLLLGLDPLLHLWVGAGEVDVTQVRYSLALLALQHGLRSTAIAGSMLLAMGAPGPIMAKVALIEAAGMVGLALPAAWLWGPTGLMIGLSLAGVLGVLGMAWFASTQLLDQGTHRSGLVRRVGMLLVAVGVLWLPVVLVAGRGMS